MEFPGEKLVIKLWETITEKGIGGLLKPWQLRREGRAQLELRREELLVLAQVEREVEEIRNGAKILDCKKIELLPQQLTENISADGSEQKVIPYLELDKVVQSVNANHLSDTIRREVNVSKAIIYAEAELENDPLPPPEKNISDDWLYRWRDSAGTVSNDELQNLWGRLLAGEIKSPGSFSLRTLEFLKNLSHEEATSISKLSPFVIDGVIFRGDKELLDKEGITYGYLLLMQELGILSGVEALKLTITKTSVEENQFLCGLCSNGYVLIVKNEDANKKFTLQACPVTSIGKQILRLGSFSPNIGYMRRVGEVIKEQGFEVQLAKYSEIENNQIHCFDEEAL